jgi:serine/threonine protein kinase
MEALAIDFDKLEVETWDDEDQNMQGVFERLSRGVFVSSRSGITGSAPFLDYSSFLAYAARYNIEMIPHNELRKVAKLGSGATMAVFRGTCPTRWGDTEVAFKRLNLELPQTISAVPLNSSELYQLLAAASLEVRVLSDSLLRFHPNIVDLLAVSWEELGEEEDPKQSEFSRSVRPILIAELACPQHATLEEYYNYSISRNMSIELDTKVSIISDVADALSAVHRCGVIHGDIKPHNILIFRKGTTLIAKISDFGGCQPPTDEFPSEHLSKLAVMGTEYWNAPEVYPDDGSDWNLQSRAVTRDYFSMGLLAYYILFEEMPFGDDRDNTDNNLARIAKLKKSPKGLVNVVHVKMRSRWTLAGQSGEMNKLLLKDVGFYERWKIFQRLYGDGKVGQWTPPNSP